MDVDEFVEHLDQVEDEAFEWKVPVLGSCFRSFDEGANSFTMRHVVLYNRIHEQVPAIVPHKHLLVHMPEHQVLDFWEFVEENEVLGGLDVLLVLVEVRRHGD